MEPLEKKIAEVFPTVVVGYANKNYLKMNSKLLELMEVEEFHGEQGVLHPLQTKDNHLERREEYRFFYDWIDECLEDYRQEFKLMTEKLSVSLSWANKSEQLNEHRAHYHPNSWISGIYYITDNPTPTYFETPLPGKTGIVVQSEGMLSANIWRCPASTGELVLFPSWLEHFTEPSTFPGKRITISLNVMPKGVTSPLGLIEHTY
jgi:uncharacterized protein (TIGR02466 family)